MRILIIGLVAFLGWSWLATYIYVCKIKGLCYEPIAMQFDLSNVEEKNSAHTLQKTELQASVKKTQEFKIYFEFDKSDFNSNNESDKYFNESNTYLNQDSQAQLSITGYTDAIGTDEYNLALGNRRAQRIQQYFISNGMLANKIIIESKGENEPADNNNTVAGRANNRRTEIKIKQIQP